MTEDDYAKTILEYMKLDMSLKKSDAVVGLGCLDTRVAERSAELVLDGYSDILVFTGGYGKITKETNKLTEAETFSKRAIELGVPSSSILLETRAANTGDNILLTQNLLAEKGVSPKSVILVTKPYMERRVYATFKRQWKDEDTEVIVTSPKLSYEQHFGDKIPKDLFLNVMVGDLQRMKEFPKLGFQIEQDIPSNVWEAFNQLVSMGYDEHLLRTD